MKYELRGDARKFPLGSCRKIYSLGSHTDGGWVSDGGVLSQQGTCWIWPGSKVYIPTKISGDVQVLGNSQIQSLTSFNGRTRVINSLITGNGEVGAHRVLRGVCLFRKWRCVDYNPRFDFIGGVAVTISDQRIFLSGDMRPISSRLNNFLGGKHPSLSRELWRLLCHHICYIQHYRNS